jgi:protein gp37
MAPSRGGNWWDGTWNPVGGCTPVSLGCKNCYAAQLAATQQTSHQIPLHLWTTDFRNEKPRFNGRLTALPAGHPEWVWPLTWPGARHPLLGPGQSSLIFVGAMTDVFHENRPVADIDKVVGVIGLSDHIGLLLTKRAPRLAEYFDAPRPEKTVRRWQQKLWLGFSAESQQEFDARWAHLRLLAELGYTVFVSVAPMLGPVRLPPDFLRHGRRVWAIASGEQGRDPRCMDANWARALRDQCAAAGVPFFLLQMAGRKPIPADLFVRQFPACTLRISLNSGVRFDYKSSRHFRRRQDHNSPLGYQKRRYGNAGLWSAR